MTATRSTQEEHAYRKYSRAHQHDACPFCAIKTGHPQYVEETKSLKVIRNRMPYSVWDGQGVTDHLMIVPKLHTDKLGHIDSEAAVEFIALVDKYETAGYNLYARAPSSKVKSVFHQHAHLIKLDGAHKRFLLFLRKPFYFRLSR